MAIQGLNTVYEKKGTDFIEKLLNKNVTITESLQGTSLYLRSGFKGFELSKRLNGQAINGIDRTINRYYEPAFEHFNGIEGSIILGLPKDWTFEFSYFIDRQPQFIMYEKLPKNSLILTGIIDSNKKHLSREVCEEWATKFNVHSYPLIFAGKLDDEQKNAIRRYCDTPVSELADKFKTGSFTKYIITLLNPSLKATCLNDSLDSPIEGVIFKFDGCDTHYRIIDPIIENAFNLLKKPTQIDIDPTYSYIAIELMNYVNTYDFSKLNLHGESFEENYVDLISTVYNSMIKKWGDRYKNFSWEVPDFLSKKQFSVNLEKITNPQTKIYLQAEKQWEELYKLMLNLFRKRKNKEFGLMTQDMLPVFNGVINRIEEKIAKQSETKINESEFLSFSEWRKLNNASGTIVDEEDELDIDLDLEEEPAKEDEPEPEPKTDEPAKEEPKEEKPEPVKPEPAPIISKLDNYFNRFFAKPEKNEEAQKCILYFATWDMPSQIFIDWLREKTVSTKTQMVIVFYKSSPLRTQQGELWNKLINGCFKEYIANGSVKIIVADDSPAKVMYMLKDCFINEIHVDGRDYKNIVHSIEYYKNTFNNVGTDWPVNVPNSHYDSYSKIYSSVVENNFASFEKYAAKELLNYWENLKNKIK